MPTYYDLLKAAATGAADNMTYYDRQRAAAIRKRIAKRQQQPVDQSDDRQKPQQNPLDK